MLKKLTVLSILYCINLTVLPSFADAYDDQFWASLPNVDKIKIPGRACTVDVAFKRNGKFLQLIGIGTKGVNRPDAVAAVREQIAKAQLPAPPTQGLYVWIACSFKDNEPYGRSGPYVCESLQEDVRLATGLKRKSYENVMEDKISDFPFDQYPATVSSINTLSHLKLSSAGVIESISISAPDSASKKFVYQLLSSSHPFGKLPANYLKSPNFDVPVSYSNNHGMGGSRVAVKHQI